MSKITQTSTQAFGGGTSFGKLMAERGTPMSDRLFAMRWAALYPAYLAKVEKKGKTKAQLDAIIAWLLGYDADALAASLSDDRDVRAFFDGAPAPNPARSEIKGVVCGIRVEAMAPGLMQEIRYLDKLVDELARGKKFENILRT